jgi:aspartate carbamoyltransferase catalytic subunit
MKALSVSHLLGIKYLQEEDLHLIFETAKHFKEVINRPIKKVPSLRDITIANLFFENSTRTKLSFELAEKRLSADVLNFSANQSSVKKGETLVDTVNNILAMKVDMVVIRHPHPGAAHFLSKRVDSCIINAGDGTHEHPSQALLDAFSLQEKFGDLSGKRIAIVGDILCDAVNMLRVQNERMDLNYFPSTREYSQNFGLTSDRIKWLRKEIVILHPGPINRGVEISSEVADSDQAIILDQVENGVAIRMAIIYLLASKFNIPIA